MIYTLRNPPKHFEALIEEHFRKRYKYILMACKTYMEGAPFGYVFAGEHVGNIKCSSGFKIALSNLYPKLLRAFSARGFHYSEFPENVKNVEVLK
ncbi:hypothetical protein L1887_17344 [Cichorium endivia]|nr:hypothetical protein L1887_17344 [Cichorium endivia]